MALNNTLWRLLIAGIACMLLPFKIICCYFLLITLAIYDIKQHHIPSELIYIFMIHTVIHDPIKMTSLAIMWGILYIDYYIWPKCLMSGDRDLLFIFTNQMGLHRTLILLSMSCFFCFLTQRKHQHAPMVPYFLFSHLIMTSYF